jgi:hypothetical protein
LNRETRETTFAVTTLAILILAATTSAVGLEHQLQDTSTVSILAQGDEDPDVAASLGSSVFSLEYHVSLSQFDQSNEFANSVAQLRNGNILSVGVDNNQANACNGNGSAWLVAVTNAGAPAYQKLDAVCPDGLQSARLVRATPDGGAVLLFGDPSNPACYICAGVAKLTSAGSISWQYELTSFFLSAIRGIQQLPTGGFVAVGQVSDTSGVYGGFIMTLSSKGALKSFSPVFHEDANSFPDAVAGSLTFDSVSRTADNGYFVSGTAEAHSESMGYFNVPVVLKFDSNLNLQAPWPEVLYSSAWGSAAPGDSNYPVFQSTDGNYVLAGTVQNPTYPFASRFALVKLGAAGNILWQYGYGGSKRTFDMNIGTAAIQNADGTFVLAGTSNAFLSSRYLAYGGWGLKVSSAGSDILWQNSYSGVPPQPGAIREASFADVTATADGGYAMAGYSYYGSATYGGPALLLDKTDANGNIGTCRCVQPTSVSPQPLDLNVYPATFTAVPSPATCTTRDLTSKRTNVKPIKIE